MPYCTQAEWDLQEGKKKCQPASVISSSLALFYIIYNFFVPLLVNVSSSWRISPRIFIISYFVYHAFNLFFYCPRFALILSNLFFMFPFILLMNWQKKASPKRSFENLISGFAFFTAFFCLFNTERILATSDSRDFIFHISSRMEYYWNFSNRK